MLVAPFSLAGVPQSSGGGERERGRERGEMGGQILSNIFEYARKLLKNIYIFYFYCLHMLRAPVSSLCHGITIQQGSLFLRNNFNHTKRNKYI